MKLIFKYNVNAKYSIKDLKGGYTGDNVLALVLYLYKKGPFLKIQLLNIFRDNHIAVQYDSSM